MSTLGLVLGSAGAAFCAMMFFMLTAFGGGGLVAPGRPPLARGVERYLNVSLLAGPALCGLLGLVPWILRPSTAGWFAGPPVVLVAQVVVILVLFRRPSP